MDEIRTGSMLACSSLSVLPTDRNGCVLIDGDVAGADDLIAASPRRCAPPLISIIAPSFNERDNVGPLCRALEVAMVGIDWELIIVDDDSPDGTAQVVWDLAHDGYPVRCIRRVGRRGLSSAVVEGVSTADQFQARGAE